MNVLKYLAVCPHDRNDIANIPEFSRKYRAGCGLTNQLFAITNSILVALTTQCNIIIIDSFLSCVQTGILMPIGEVLDLEETSRKISDLFGFNIYLLDRSNISISLKKAEYGLKGLSKVVDVTKVVQSYSRPDKIILPPNSNFNAIFGIDPIPGYQKILYLQIQINNYLFNVEHYEYPNHILYDKNYLTKTLFANKSSDFEWWNKFNQMIFNKILFNLIFNQKFYQIVEKIAPKERVNIIHLRIEEDYITHLRDRKPNFSRQSIKEVIYHFYRQGESILTEDYYILTGEPEKISEVFGSDPKFKHIPKEIKDNLIREAFGIMGRELNAIIDLLFASKYGKNLIGGFSIYKDRGSTFSYYLFHYLSGIKIMIDLQDGGIEIYS